MRGPRRRRCLLKGCEQFFQSRYPQSRYGGAACQQSAKRWRCWPASRGLNRSTALVTSIGFEAWADYLGDAPLAMAILDRLVDGAIVMKIEGRSYRARGVRRRTPPPADEIGNAKQIPKIAG